jgi:hypothetical protein
MQNKNYIKLNIVIYNSFFSYESVCWDIGNKMHLHQNPSPNFNYKTKK